MEPIAAGGDQVRLLATHSAHFGYTKTDGKAGVSGPGTSFGETLKNALYRVNDLQQDSEHMTRALAVQPDSVDIHDVTIAAEKARLSLVFTKSVVDKVTQAYREIINMR